MNKTAYFGTSTWTYPGWEGIVYRDVSSYGRQFKSECLSEYARSDLFDCVGIDSTFYGVIFNDSFNNIASFFPDSGGYAPLLQGKVVDMFYLPIINNHFPSWIPFWGDEHFIFFRPVFNVADAGISIGVCCILIFYRKLFS